MTIVRIVTTYTNTTNYINIKLTIRRTKKQNEAKLLTELW